MERLLPACEARWFLHVRALYVMIWCPPARYSSSFTVCIGAPVVRRSSMSRVLIMRLLNVANRKRELSPCNTRSTEISEMWKGAGLGAGRRYVKHTRLPVPDYPKTYINHLVTNFCNHTAAGMASKGFT